MGSIRRAGKRIAFVLATMGGLASSPGCGDGGGGGPPPPPSRAFQTGVAAQAVTLGPDGRLGSDVVLETGSGVRVTAAAGTSVRRRRGTRVVGPVVFGVDDAGGAGDFPGDRTYEGVIRPYLLDGTTGDLVDARFDPPLSVEVDLGEWTLPGSWLVRTNVGAAGRVLGPPPADLSAPGNEGTPVDLGEVPVERLCGDGVLTEDAGPLAYEFLPFPGAGAPLHYATTTVEAPLPGSASDTWPRVYSWRLINPDTAQIVAVGQADPALTNGGSQTVTGVGGTPFTASVVTHDGQRFLQVTSPVQNRFSVEVRLCQQDGSVTTSLLPMTGGSQAEADTSGTYVGVLEIEIFGWGGARESLTVEQVISGAAPAGASTTTDSFQKTGAQTYVTGMSLHDYAGSAQTFAASLPAGWTVTVENRRIVIHIPCPETVALTASSAPAACEVRDVDDFAVTASFPLPAGPLEGALASNGARAFLGLPGGLRVTEIPSGAFRDVPVASFAGSAMAVGAFEDEVLLVTGAGEVVAVDPDSGAERWRLTGLPAAAYADLATASDGAFAYVAAPGAGFVREIDLVHRTLGRSFAIPGATRLSLADDGLALAVVAPAGLYRVGLADGLVGPPLVAAVGLTDVQFSPGSTYLLVAHATGTVEVRAAEDGDLVGTAAVGAAALSLASYVDAGGDPIGLVATDGPALGRLPILDAPHIPAWLFPQPTAVPWVRTNGQ